MRYQVMLARTEYLAQVIEVEADTKELAIDKAWDLSGKWKCVEADEFTNEIQEVS